MVKTTKRLETKLTKSEQLLLRIGQLVDCDICHEKVIMGSNWLMTAERDNYGEFINKQAICPKCRPSVAKTGVISVSI